jgi:hypothetical protein
MKLVDNTIYIEWAEALVAGLSANTLKNAKLRNSPSWGFLDDPDDKRKVLICFDKLKEDNQAKIVAKFGEPKKYLMLAPIRNLVKYDDKAEAFYLDYRYSLTPTLSKGEGAKALSREHVDKYTAAASFLNMLRDTTKDKRELKKLLNLTLEEFYDRVCEIISSDKIDLPTSYRRLAINEDSALKKYVKEGYASLIDWRFGNKHAAKINDEVSEAALLEMIAHSNQYDDVIIAGQYNKWVASQEVGKDGKTESKYKTIDPATVGLWRRKKESDIIMFREGNAALKEKYLKQANGFRPTNPMLLVESDDNQLDLLFQDAENPKATKRYVAIVVTDSFNDYVLGYAYALLGEFDKDGTIDLVKAAYLNAMYHIKWLTGNWHLQHESKTDRWGLKQLMPFYKGMGKYFETPVGSKNRGYLENFFGSNFWKNSLKIGANNYSGNNITALSRGVNMEALAKNKKIRPLIGNDAHAQIDNFFHRLRVMPQSNGVSKQAHWLEAWNAMPAELKRPISDEQFLLKFGVEHNYRGEGLRIRNSGIRAQIGNAIYKYDLATYRMEDINKEVSLLFDPMDMSRVLVTNHKDFRMMAYDKRLNPRALEDCKDTDSRSYLNAIFANKKESVTGITERSERRKMVLESAGYDAEGLLQAGVMVKELKQAAEHKQLMSMMGEDDYDILDQL